MTTLALPPPAEIKAHPLAELFPMLPDQEIAELADDIVTYGQRVPIVIHEMMVLDGRNRLAACLFAQVEPVFEFYEGDDPLGFVLSHNLHRRHLTASQRAMVAASIVDWEHGLNQNTAGSANLPTRKAAERLSISERAVIAAKRIREHGSAELVQAIRDGRVSVHAGEALSDLAHEAQREALAAEEREIIRRAKEIRAARQELRHAERLANMERIAAAGRPAAPRKLDRLYAVYHADPPWRFAVHSETTGREKSAENHYPTMATEEIAALLAELIGGESPAVFFCWATNPMLPDALKVLAACGFTYVHHWVWDKEVAGTGFWGRDRHELLLIGRRGDVASPLPGSQPETVFRVKKGRHSAKPDVFAETIEKLFPGVSRLELFARRARPGWDAWGFEAAGERIRSAQDEPMEPSPATGQPPVGEGSPDPEEALLYAQSVVEGRISARRLQRRLQIDYGSARALLDLASERDVSPRLIELIVTGMQSEAGRQALIAALDIMIEGEAGGEADHDAPPAGAVPA